MKAGISRSNLEITKIIAYDEEMKYYERDLEPLILKALQQFPVILITGPRQAGKSTLLKHALPDLHFVTLDDPLVRARAAEDPALFLDTLPQPCIIDEIQYVPELLPYIKLRVDEKREWYGRFILTGSQIFQLMQGVAESLAGRVAIFQLYPFSWAEITQIPTYTDAAKENRQTLEGLVQGFYPEFYKTPDLDKTMWYGSYMQTYVERDVRTIQAVADLPLFQKFLRLLATRVGNLLNLSEVARDCGIAQPTAKAWLAILEATYLVYLLRPHFNNRSKRLVKSPKLYFVDTGLLCYLMGIGSVERLLGSREQGAIFENMVIMDQIKKATAAPNKRSFSFYRTMDGVEVDLIIEEEGTLVAYELKFSEQVNQKMGAGLTHFLRSHPESHGKILCLRREPFPLTRTVIAEHWSSII